MKKLVAMLAIALLCASGASARPGFSIDGNIGLQSFVSLTDAHVEATLRGSAVFATSSIARSGNWKAIEAPPDGRYWVAGKGLQSVRISDRQYFVSRAAGAPVAIVAVPVRGVDGSVVGMVSAGIDLAKLTSTPIREMGIGSDVVFWATDAGIETYAFKGAMRTVLYRRPRRHDCWN